MDESGNYSAKKALDYAKKWWNKQNVNYYSYGTGGDCANFVSQCLYEGGLKKDSKWYSYHSSKKKKGWDIQYRFSHLKYNPFTGQYMPVYKPHWYNVSSAWSLAKGLFNYLKTDLQIKYCKCKNAKEVKSNRHNHNQGTVL